MPPYGKNYINLHFMVTATIEGPLAHLNLQGVFYSSTDFKIQSSVLSAWIHTFVILLHILHLYPASGLIGKNLS